MLILTGCHVTCESSLLTHVESSGITPWYMGRSLARLFLMTSMFFYSSLPLYLTSIFSCMKIETSISMDDILNNSFELLVNTKNLLFSR